MEGRWGGQLYFFTLSHTTPRGTAFLGKLSTQERGEEEKENPACIALSLLCANCAAERKEETT